jgi:hypothetical protein
MGGQPWFNFRREKIGLLSMRSMMIPRPTQPSLQWQKHETDHSCPSTAEVKMVLLTDYTNLLNTEKNINFTPDIK